MAGFRKKVEADLESGWYDAEVHGVGEPGVFPSGDEYIPVTYTFAGRTVTRNETEDVFVALVRATDSGEAWNASVPADDADENAMPDFTVVVGKPVAVRIVVDHGNVRLAYVQHVKAARSAEERKVTRKRHPPPEVRSPEPRPHRGREQRSGRPHLDTIGVPI